jgi:flavorubredoxin
MPGTLDGGGVGADVAGAHASNQFLVIDGDNGAIIDPGGTLACSDLYLAMTAHFPPRNLSAILTSHADPDIIASLDRWLTATTSVKVYIWCIWERFVPHFCKAGKTPGGSSAFPMRACASESGAAN